MGSDEITSTSRSAPDFEAFEPSESFEPAERMVVTELRQLRVMANRLHCEIIDEITSAAKTVAEVATSLGIPSPKLYYHFRELTNAGLIRCVAPNGVTRHRRYRAAAHYYQLSSQMLHAENDLRGQQAGVEFLAGAIETSARSLRRSFAQGVIDQSTASFLVQRRFIQVTASRAAEFRDRLLQLAHEFMALDEPEGELAIELALALFPRASVPAGGTRPVSERARRMQAKSSKRSQSQVR